MSDCGPDAPNRLADAPGKAEASRDRLSVLAEQQAALRRVATLVARGASPSEVFAAVAEEMARCLHVENASVMRYESDDTAVVLAVAAVEPRIRRAQVYPEAVGTRLTLEGDNTAMMVLRTGRPARMESFENATGSVAEAVQELGLCSGVSVPIVVGGRVWGTANCGSPRPMPAGTEERMADFADLVATSIANAVTREELQASRDRSEALAAQQAALRRVAVLVARGASQSEVFEAVAQQVAQCVRINNTSVSRFTDDTMTFVALANLDPGLKRKPLVGDQFTLDGENVATGVIRTGRATRMEAKKGTGTLASYTREVGLEWAVGAPIIVDGRVWGMIGCASIEPLPDDTEERMSDFAELVATAIAKAAARDELIASRARIVAAADDARRRIERDLHDGAQQRLVTLGLQARMAEAAVPAELELLRSQLSDLASGLGVISTELQEISRGIHPAILSDGGLKPALKTLARRCPIPTNVDVLVERRLPDSVEVAAYYVVAEALTNAAKYAQAANVNVCAQLKDATLCLSIQDDGIGGADSRKGSGLIGLKDRVEVLGGRMKVISPPGSGTTLHVTIPLPG